ncbi:MAG: YihY/virulence factor BrkB family protein [Geminicoccaceae bacterium]
MARSAERGRQADRPFQIPRAGWRDILLRTKNEISADHLSLIAAGVGFYGLLALFPAIAATIAIWGLAFDPQQIEPQIAAVSGLLPEQAAAIVTDQARKVAASGGGLGLAAAGGILLTLYSASKGMKALIEGLNIIYDEEEKRGFIKLNLTALGLTLGVIVGMTLAIGLIVLVPVVLQVLGLGSVVNALVTLLRWPILFVGALLILAALYRYAPSRAAARWRWVGWGAALATLIWVIGSIAFSIYVRNFGSYNETYGSIGAVIVLLMWVWLSAFVVLLGAELNSEMELQTERDSTTGPPQPRGRRGAHVADEVGESP